MTAAEVDRGLAALHGYALADISETDTVRVHRVIRAAARRNASPEAAESTVALLQLQADGNARNPTRWPTIAALVPHALTVGATVRTTSEHGPDLSWALDDLAVLERTDGAGSDSITGAFPSLEFSTTHLDAEQVQALEGSSPPNRRFHYTDSTPSSATSCQSHK